MLVAHRLKRLDLPQLLDINEYLETDALIEAKSDLEAVQQWLMRFNNDNTLRAYSRDAMRFLLWLIFVSGKHIHQLLLDDIHKYITFLQNPTSTWCMHNKKLSRYDARWRPFSKALSKRSVSAAISALQSLFAFLEEANFIAKNPVRLVKTSSIIGNIQAQKYNVYSRMLEMDEWQAVLSTLQELPTNTEIESKYKARANLLFCMLYLLGLRIEEASTSAWANFRKLDGRWWFFIIGKGGKLGQVPVNEVVLQAAYNYRQIYNLNADIEQDSDFIFKAERNINLSSRTLYSVVKKIGKLTAVKFKNKAKREKLQALSPHWLRHLSASHQDKRGVPLIMIRDNHRHASINTTQIYMHSEDVARHEIMQEHSIDIAPVAPKVKNIEYYLSISLTKGPLDKIGAMELIRSAIEINLLKNAQIIDSRPLLLKYRLREPVAGSVIDSIKMLCKVWLFEVIIEQGMLCPN